MNTEAYVDWLNEGSFEQPSDTIMQLSKGIGGFSAPYLMTLISQAVSLLDEGEIYLEIGTYLGRTLIGAMIDNPSKLAVAVDNFSKFEGTPEVLHANIGKFELGEQIRFFEMDDDTFFETTMPSISEKVGVYFYDGDHNTDAGVKNLCAIIPYLADEAIIILDDFSSHGIWRSVQEFMNLYSRETALLFCMRTNNSPFPNDRWWNGVVVIGWKANRSPATGV